MERNGIIKQVLLSYSWVVQETKISLWKVHIIHIKTFKLVVIVD